MKTIRNLTRHSFYLGAGLVMFLFNGCSDDIFNNSSDERLISFKVSTPNNEKSETNNTRSVSSRPLNILPLNGDNMNLYLVPYSESSENNHFSEMGNTRSDIVTTSNISSAGVFAGYASEKGSSQYAADYMNNVEITKDNDWTPKDEYLWPGQDALHFNAYSPYCSSPSTEGITALNSSAGEPTLSFKVPSDVSEQIDLLYASPIDASSSPCALSFLHAMTGIRFVTGAELIPCVIKKISISGSFSSGVLNLETGSWSELNEKEEFSVSPMLTLSPAEGSQFVEAGCDIMPSGNTFFLIPQTLGDDAAITITFDFNGEETVLTSSLASQEFQQGKTITYRISANPEADSLILNITGDFATQYKGSNNTFNVKSSASDNGTTVPVSWIAEFVDDNGHVIDRPNWISAFTMSGDGDAEGTLSTVLQDGEFETMSAPTQNLQNSADINTTSGHSPYNLSSSTGSETIENTANTYIINAPGSYSIPLVYGNAIKNGTANTSAYITSTHNSHALKNFTNHLNNPITSPYIYENSGCTPDEATLIWEDGLNLVCNVRLSDNKKNLVFDVPKNLIRQGNALLSVLDAQGQVMWSWQIWVTDYNPSAGYNNLTVSGKTYQLASQNLGYISGGDKVNFPEVSVKVRFTQTNLPDDKTPLSKTITITQSGIVCTTAQYNPYYQWGRKDPMMSAFQSFYDAEHNTITSLPSEFADYYTSGKNLMQAFILHPDTFYMGSHSGDENENNTNWTPYPYNNFWDISYSTSNPKTIYDPNPVGYVVPYNQPLLDFTPEGKNNPSERYEFKYESSESVGPGFYLTVKETGDILYFPALGYRSGSTATTTNSGQLANYWLSHAMTTLKTGGIVQFFTTPKINAQQTTDPLFHGMSIRGIKE